MADDDAVYNDDGEDHPDLLHPVQILKNHLRLIHKSVIIDYIRTRYLGERLIHECDLYASIYGIILSNTIQVVVF